MEMEFADKDWFLIFQLSKIGALKGLSKSTTEIAMILSSSQQTISRRLKNLLQMGYLITRIDGDKEIIQISEKGRSILHLVFHDLKNLLVQEKNRHYYGHVQTGLGEGKFYIQLPEYNKQFAAIIGNIPFPGTLNITLESENLEDFYYTLSQKEFLIIHGFESNERSYGEVKCYPICLQSNGKSQDEIKCLLVDIKRTSHQIGTIEIVSSKNLRSALQLIDGSLVRLAFCE